MRIAVASDDGLRVAQHTGRCAGFVVYELMGNTAIRIGYRQNTFTAHARGECHGEHEHGGSGEHHAHGPLLTALGDCRVLVTRGLGPRLVVDLAGRDIDAYVCGVDGVEEAAQLYAAGALPKACGSGCGRHSG